MGSDLMNYIGLTRTQWLTYMYINVRVDITDTSRLGSSAMYSYVWAQTQTHLLNHIDERKPLKREDEAVGIGT